MINYGTIQRSIEFYEAAAFKRIESPWTVAESISNITKPTWATSFTIKEKNKVLVASGEQSFLAMYNKGFLPKGAFQTVTPCFRDDTFSPIHTKYFIKNELIITDDPTENSLMDMIDVARQFFRRETGGKEITLKKLEDGSFDLYLGDIELGSYGIRSCPFLTWIYGTGVAEPRLTRAMQHYGIPPKKDS